MQGVFDNQLFFDVFELLFVVFLAEFFADLTQSMAETPQDFLDRTKNKKKKLKTTASKTKKLH